MTSSTFLSIFYLFIILLFILPFNHSTAVRSVRVKLVHVDSISNNTKYKSFEQRDQEWTSIARTRLLQIHHELKLASTHDEKIPQPPYVSQVIIDPAGVFLASIGMGDPAVPHLLQFDTGSKMMVVTCAGSKVQTSVYYDCSSSKTCNRLYCLDPECPRVPYSWSECMLPSNECKFMVKYLSVPDPIQGTALKDTLTFWNSGVDGENITVPGVLFGCGTIDDPIHDHFTGTGVLGLANHDASVASQFGSVFSYCVGNIYDASYKFNNLILGEEANLEGNYTPIGNIIGKIFFNLQSITLDGEVLPIDVSIFQRHNSDGGTIFDSGSARTLLADDAYITFYDALKKKIDPYNYNPALCFSSLDVSSLPVIQFVFEGGANLTQRMDVFFDPPPQGSTLRCFKGIKSTELTTGYPEMRNYTIIGINAQQYHNIGFDYGAGRVYMIPAECDEFTES